jgi:hypothetical protein
MWYLGNMAYDLDYWPAADDALTRLERDPKMAHALDAADRTLAKLASDPFDRRLGTTSFQSEELGGVCVTPTRLGDWYVVWQRGPQQGLIDIINVLEIIF